MKKAYASKLISLFAVLLIMTAFSLPVCAAETTGTLPAVYTMQTADIGQDDSGINSDKTVSVDTDADADTEKPSTPAEDVQYAEPVKAKSSNAPFLTGAVLAVLAFIGVAVFCKVKGNK